MTKEEESIVENIKLLVGTLNKRLIQAAKNDIEVQFDALNTTQIGDKSKRTHLQVGLFKKL